MATAPYVINPDDPTNPTENLTMGAAAAELRALKQRVLLARQETADLETRTLSHEGANPYELDAQFNANENKITELPQATEASDAVPLAQVLAIVGAASSGIIASVRQKWTATEGQTTFVLTLFTYVPTANNLAVYVNGLRQDVGTSYTETSSTTFTFTSGLTAGDVVQAFSNESVNANAVMLLRADLASTASGKGSEMVAFKQSGTGAIDTTVDAVLNETVSVKRFGAVGDGMTDDTAAIQAAIDYAAAFGGEVFLPAALYRTTTTIVLHRKVTMRGQGAPFPGAAYNPTQQFTGAVIRKEHSGHGITVAGPSAYSEGAGIFNVSIVSNYDTWPTGDGIRIDKVGAYTIEQCNVWSCGGNGFTLGVTADDVTGQIFVRNLSVNNCLGTAYSIRSKWLRAYNIISDGCAYGAWFQDSPESYVDGFHFEGFSNTGIKLAGACGWSTFMKGFVSLTAASPTRALDIESYPGNTNSNFNSVKFIGRAGAGIIGVFVGSGAWNTRFNSCSFQSSPVAIRNEAFGTMVSESVFDSNDLPIYEMGSATRIRSNTFQSTVGSWNIDHQGGGDGVWSENKFDKPINSGVYGQPGNYGTNIVVNNTGFKTAAKGTTGAITSGTVIPHGMSVTPSQVFVQPVSPFSIPSGMKVGWTATNITINWTGGGNIQFAWQAFSVCSGQG